VNHLDDSRDPEDWETKLRSAILGAEGQLSRASHPRPSVYSGEGGVALMLLRRSPRGVRLPAAVAVQLLHQLEEAERGFHRSRVSFLEGLPGNLALQAAVHWRQGEGERVRALVARVEECERRVRALDPGECEVLYGRCGYLGAILFLRREFGDATLMTEVAARVVADVVASGRDAAHGGWPLYYEWHDKCYFGGAHGLAGILFTLLQLPEELARCKGAVQLVRAAADALLAKRFLGGNLPSSEGSSKDRLVHWCHGATGLVPLLLQLAGTFREPSYLAMAAELGEVIWRRGLLSTKGPGLCHGIPGNGYALLTLHRADPRSEAGMTWLRRARHFAVFVAGRCAELLPYADRPYSMFEGLAGALAFWHDVLRASECPEEAGRFPGYDF